MVIGNPFFPITLIIGYCCAYSANILFCFFNQQYWLYAVENYAYNLYFLFMVGYVCRAYLLKTKSAKLSAAKENSGENKNKEKTLFYAIFIALLVLYTGIFTASLMRELNSDGDSSGKVRYCEGKSIIT